MTTTDRDGCYYCGSADVTEATGPLRQGSHDACFDRHQEERGIYRSWHGSLYIEADPEHAEEQADAVMDFLTARLDGPTRETPITKSTAEVEAIMRAENAARA